MRDHPLDDFTELNEEGFEILGLLFFVSYYCVILCYVMFCFLMLCDVALCYGALRYFMLWQKR